MIGVVSSETYQFLLLVVFSSSFGQYYVTITVPSHSVTPRIIIDLNKTKKE